MIKQLFTLMLAACAAVILVSSCQDPAPERDPNPEEEIKQIPFSLTVSTEATKVSYASGKYEFKSGDKLRVVGVDRTDVRGDLEQNGDKWSGVLIYTGEKPAEGTPLTVTLIHADNSVENTYASAIVGTVPEGSSLLKEAVEKYSLFTANVNLSYSTVPAVVLLQQATFLDVTVTFDFDGSCAVSGGKALVDLVTPQGKTTVKTDLAALPGGEDFTTQFMAVVPGGQSVSSFTLTVADREIAFSDNSLILSANKKYTVNRNITYRPQLGDPFWSDGTYGRLVPANANVSVVGIIVYVNHNYTDPDKAAIDDAITEKAAGYGHGLVMALHNAATDVKWSEASGKVQCTSNYVTTPSQTLLASNLSGYSNTNSIITTLGSSAVSAATRAKNYSLAAAPSNTTGWFLPAIGQWLYTISEDGFGGVNPVSEWITNSGSNKKWLTNGSLTDLVLVKECDSERVNMMIKALNDRLELLKNDFSDYYLTYDSFGDPSATNNISDNYWTSTEYDENNAIRMNLGTVEKKGDIYYSSLKARYEEKTKITVYTLDNIQYKMKVRSFLAF